MNFEATKARTARWMAATLVILAAGCYDDPVDPGPPDPPDPPEYGQAVLTPAAANVNSAAVVVEATGYDHVRLRLRTPGEPDETPPPYPFVDGMAHASALGMLAERDYSVDVLVTVGAETDSAETLVHSTGSLPDWLPAVASTGDPADGGSSAWPIPPGRSSSTIRAACDGT